MQRRQFRSRCWAFSIGFFLILAGFSGWSTNLSAARADAPKYESLRNVVYVSRGDEPLKADVFVPVGPGPFPAVLVVHGGAWMSGSKAQMTGVASMLAEHGYTAVAINYRLAPRHQFPAQIEDCKAAVRWMRENAERYKIDPERIGGYGYSAGGHLVALLGTTDPQCGLEDPTANPNGPSTRLTAVVAGGAPCEFRVLPPDTRLLAYWLGGTRSEKPDAYALASPLKFVTKDDPPLFFFHGESDRLVPIASPQAMVRQLTSLGIKTALFTVPKADHISAFFDTAAASAALEFLDQHLKPAAPEEASP